MDNKMLVGIGFIIAVIAIAAIWTGSIDTSTFAAIPTGNKLPDVTLGSVADFDVTFALASDSKAVSQMWYRLEMYDPDDVKTCYPTSCGWLQTSGIAAGGTVTVSDTDGFFTPTKLGRHNIIVYTGDSAATTDATKIYWDTFSRSAYDESLYTACTGAPTSYGCTDANKVTCCHGSGYYFNVVAAPLTEYKGSVTIS